ncbi:MAG: type II toxin-antitoxin system RelE/ParE family toxin [Verrucomicrobia bacterium]|nr:type II toxin-antitoxin system RelE/ParE family toxin [Verrucomicrobiota bacterium]
MGCKIVFTKPAIADLKGLVSFIARDNPQAAERFGYVIIARAEKLDQFPLLGRVVPEFKMETIREIIHRPYRIVCRVREEQNLIEILRVWHAARGIPRLHE